MLILRFKRCNRVEEGRGCYFCDTKVKMRIIELAEYSYKTIQDVINRTNCGIMITGGEPTYDTQYADTVDLLRKLKYPICNIETNGYNLPKLLADVTKKNVKFIWSPKVFTDGDLDDAMKYLEEVKDDKRVFIKAVVRSEEDKVVKFLDYLKEKNYEICSRTYLMPEGKDFQELYNNSMVVFDLAEKYSFNFSSRNHLIFGFV
jgi:organic radical activating enzyme